MHRAAVRSFNNVAVLGLVTIGLGTSCGPTPSPSSTIQVDAGCTQSWPYAQPVPAAWHTYITICSNARTSATDIDITNTSQFMLEVYPTAGNPVIRLVGGTGDPKSKAQLAAAQLYQTAGPRSVTVPPLGSASVSFTPGRDYVWLALDRDANQAAMATGALIDYVERHASSQEDSLQDAIARCVQGIYQAWNAFIQRNQYPTLSTVLSSVLSAVLECKQLVEMLRRQERASTEQQEGEKIVAEERDQVRERAADLIIREQVPKIPVIRP